MRFYIMGYDNDRIILMTSKIFSTLEQATIYADGCAKGWDSFVVQVGKA